MTMCRSHCYVSCLHCLGWTHSFMPASNGEVLLYTQQHSMAASTCNTEWRLYFFRHLFVDVYWTVSICVLSTFCVPLTLCMSLTLVKHIDPSVVRNCTAYFFLFCCYFRNFDFLIPDAPELIATFLEGEQDMSCKRNAFMMLIHADQVWEGYIVYIGVSLIIWAPGS